jgi:AsmA protein
MKWLLVAVAAVVVLAIAAMAAVPRLVDTPRVQSLIASTASQSLGRPVKFRGVSISVLPYPTVRLHGLEVAEDPAFGPGPFLRLDDAVLRLRLWALVRGQVEFTTLVLKQPVIGLIQGVDGRWNFASLGAARETASAPRVPPRTGGGAAAPAALVSRIVVEKGQVTYETRQEGRGGGLRQRVEDVDLTLSPRPGALAFSGSARVMPGELAVKISDGTVGLSGARILAEGSVRAQIEIEGKDVQPMVAAVLGPEPGITGAVSGRLNVSGTVARPRAAGELELRSPAVMRTDGDCPEPRRRTLALSTVKANVSWDAGRLVVQPLSSGIGDGAITTKLTASPAPPLPAELSDLRLQGIPLEKVLVDFLCQGYAVTGALDLTGTLTLSGADPLRTVSGAGHFRVGPGKVVGARALALLGGVARVGGAVSSVLSLDLPAALFASPLDFESIAGTYQIKHGVVTTRDVLYTSRAMKAKVVGDYVIPTGRINADIVLEHGRGLMHAKVTGTAESPAIRVAPPTVLRGVEPERVERGFKDLLNKFR